ncbi:class I SAM-dependent methyltransferase [Dyadobacter fermentans]|uniref:class I SAM-dependent methyltransferase n=1 Tax=Dyadobacter fermentans TaxID=94254 RepID=UPI001CBD6035|nr:class I SAM-dependent methyltransferase [Dyadobacter fermentans]MBZ1362428.1 class I SAM-dependent methyltransferase [Dyadobacter fermentans]
MQNQSFASLRDADRDAIVLPAHSCRVTTSDVVSLLVDMLNAGGPRETEYPLLDALMEELFHMQQTNRLDTSTLNLLQALFQDEFLAETMHGYVYRKPLGYAGDFRLIDMIYTHHQSGHEAYERWDRYFHYNAATEAVRNRKDFFKNQLLHKIARRKKPLHLLNVASGPARDLYELYGEVNADMLVTTCVDVDADAIAFASELCSPYAEQISFHQKNILRFSSAEKYDVIWSAGLFDYFEDRLFVMALKRLLTMLRPGGEILIGNFSEHNPSRGYMELFGEWFLIHRSREELIALSLEAGVQPELITVEQEPLGINLFLKIKSPVPADQAALCMN